MKIGDHVFSTKTRPYENAIIIQADISNRLNLATGRKETRTKYIAEYPDRSKLHFTGANCNKSVFRSMTADGQICLEDFYCSPEEYIEEVLECENS